MNEYDKQESIFWFGVCAIVAIVVMTVISAIVVHDVTVNRTIEHMSLNGIDPMIAACSMHVPSDVVCTVVITQGRK